MTTPAYHFMVTFERNMWNGGGREREKGGKTVIMV